MPEPDTSGGRDLVQMLERFSSELKGVARGGVYKFPNYKLLTVNIRPPKWPTGKSSRFWIGQLESFEVAQRVADGVYYYVGKAPVHFKNAVVTYPPLTCIGTMTGIPEVLSTQEMCSRYVRLIAKGTKYESQRKDFIQQVVEKVTKRFGLAPPEVENVTRRFGLAPPEEEVGDDDDREEDAPPLEFDEHSAKALEMSSSGGSAPVFPTRVSHVAVSDSLLGSDSLRSFVPSFEIHSNGSGNILQSAGQSLNDCLNILSEDEKKFRSGNETIEDLSKSSVVQPSTVVSNAGEVYPSQCLDDCPTSEDEVRIWIVGLNESSVTQTSTVVSNAGQCLDDYPTISEDEFRIWIEGLNESSVTSNAGQELCEIGSPILNIPPTVCRCALPLSKTMLVSVASVERAVSLGTVRGNSEDRLAMNAKRQKIGG